MCVCFQGRVWRWEWWGERLRQRLIRDEPDPESWRQSAVGRIRLKKYPRIYNKQKKYILHFRKLFSGCILWAVWSSWWHVHTKRQTSRSRQPHPPNQIWRRARAWKPVHAQDFWRAWRVQGARARTWSGAWHSGDLPESLHLRDERRRRWSADRPHPRPKRLVTGAQPFFTWRHHDACLFLRAGAFRVEMQRDSQRDRTIQCRYDPTEVGLYIVSVCWSGQHVPGSPFQVHICDTQAELARVARGDGQHSATSPRRAQTKSHGHQQSYDETYWKHSKINFQFFFCY